MYSGSWRRGAVAPKLRSGLDGIEARDGRDRSRLQVLSSRNGVCRRIFAVGAIESRKGRIERKSRKHRRLAEGMAAVVNGKYLEAKMEAGRHPSVLEREHRAVWGRCRLAFGAWCCTAPLACDSFSSYVSLLWSSAWSVPLKPHVLYHVYYVTTCILSAQHDSLDDNCEMQVICK